MVKPLIEYLDSDIIIDSLTRYAQHKIPTGSFLRAVLENDLVEAVARADIHNINRLPAIVQWCYENLTHNAWGSKEIVKKFLQDGGRTDKGVDTESEQG